MRGNSMSENWEIPQSSETGQDRSEKACGQPSDTHDGGKSEEGTVPTRAANKGGESTPAEWQEGKPKTEGNFTHEHTGGTQRPHETVYQQLRGVREAAQRDANLRLTALMHHITPGLLRASYDRLNPKAATGVDEQTWQEYGKQIGTRISDLHERVQSQRYKARPSRRIYIPKADGRMRPIGIAALEDKIVQQAVVTVLNEIYETQFKGFSYGFRPRRNQHQALDALSAAIITGKVNWIVDADIRSFFDTLDHKCLMKMVEHRIGDPRILRLIRKWLRAGISEEGRWEPGTIGTPQGAVISPLLANIYLHYALDLWVDKWRSEKATGEVYIVRYADDFVMGFQHQSDAQRFLEALKEQLGQYGLELHEQKTRLIEFGRFAARDRKSRNEGKPETFDFLGFTHIASTTRKSGAFMVQRLPIAKRLRAKAKAIGEKLRRMMHEPVKISGQYLHSVFTGILNYYAVPGTAYILSSFRKTLVKQWVKVLRRRSHKSRCTPWRRYDKLIDTWIPRVRITHPYPLQRFLATHPDTFGRSRMR